MTSTMIGIDDEETAPAMLDTKDVADTLKVHAPEFYEESRRMFYSEVNLHPFKKHSKDTLHFIEWMFWDWLAFDRRIGLSGSDGEQLEINQYDDGMSPYLALARVLHNDGKISDRQLDDMSETDDTNFTSVFWIRNASAARRTMRLEDAMNGGEYTVSAPGKAAEYDGARGGMIVTRIAKVRGSWRPCAISIYEARRPDSPKTRLAVIDAFGSYRTDFPGLVRFFYGRAKDTGLDWEDTEALLHDGTRGSRA
ncbi:hypothetical protein [Bifidobacterium biavatii]|uniref:Uncharacterized protein n=1 Tax=Bifidobacterium biavatii DSM 23969 TaxID=1437608 RepID=A0A086ZZ14_9BIFI|nr:hypothetical protein [Bifidobacterium biavatii]KFI51764.1 hypothetical protein BBIA_0680 [Bifidobacterium biavatii DSM 23969]